jgi:CRP-like cAMP-binding protein
MEATQVNLALFWDDCLQVCYSQISWAAYLWELLRWAIGAALLAFVVHYCWYQFVWKQLTRIPDDARAPRKPQKRPSINDGNDMKGVMSFRERREKLALIGDVGDFLESLELFGYFERGAREIMKEMSREVLVKQGDSIPDGGHDFYILKQGRMRVCSHDEPEDLMALMVTLPGSPVASLFNIALAMLGDDSTAAIPRLFRMAEEDSTCVVIPAEAFRAIKERVPLQARTMVQAVFMRFQRITCSGLLQHLGLLDDLTVVEFAASSNCASSMPRGGDEAMPEIECLKDLQRKAVKVLLEALRMEAVGDLLDSTDLAHEAKVECVLTGQPICNESIYYVSSGVIAASSPESGAAHYVSAGGCLIVTSVLLGSKCPFQFKAMTACVLVRLERPSIMKIFEQCRGTCKSFVQLIVPRISSFLAFVDLGLNWIHVDAGTPVCFQDTAVNACYLVLHGRLRSVRRIAKGTDQVVEVGGGGNFGEAEIMNESEWPGTICAIRDSELARIPRDLFAMLLKARPSVSSTLAKTLALHPRHRQPNTERMSLFDRTNRQDIKTLAILPLSAQHMALAEDFCTRLYRQIAATDSVAILTKASVLDALGRQAFTACGKLRLMEWLNGLEDRNRIVIYFAADSPNSPWTKQCIRQVLNKLPC